MGESRGEQRYCSRPTAQLARIWFLGGSRHRVEEQSWLFRGRKCHSSDWELGIPECSVKRGYKAVWLAGPPQQPYQTGILGVLACGCDRVSRGPVDTPRAVGIEVAGPHRYS